MKPHLYFLHVQVASLASLAQLLPPCSPTVRNPAPDSSLCRAASPRLRPLQLLLPSPIAASASTAAPPFASASSCCSPIESASAAARRLRPLQLLLPDCVRFNCCSPIASASTTARPIERLRLTSPAVKQPKRPPLYSVSLIRLHGKKQQFLQ